MIWLTGLLITMLVLAADFATTQPVTSVSSHLFAGLICLMLAPAFAVLQSFVTVRRWKDRTVQSHRAEFLHRSLLGSNLVVWLFGCVALLAVAKWPRLIRENWGLDAIPLLDEVLLAVPMLGSVLLAWYVIYEAESSLHTNGEIDPVDRKDLPLQRFRTFAGLVLVPLAMMFLLRDLTNLSFPDGLTPTMTCFCYIAFLAILLSFYPTLLSLTWRTEKLQNEKLAKRLRQAASEAGLSRERFRVWLTDKTVTNALVVGILPGLRRVFISDNLLEHFDDDEVEAVYRHEIGHVVHNHLHMRIAMVMMPLLAIFGLAFFAGNQLQAFDYASNSVRTFVWIVAVLIFLFYASQVVTRFVRKSEVQADLFAVTKSDGTVCRKRADAYCRAMLKMAAISPDLLDNTTAAHPSIRMRVEVIRQVLEEPSRMSRFNERFRNDQIVAAVCLACIVLVPLLYSAISSA